MKFASDNLINKRPSDLLPYERNSRVHSDEQKRAYVIADNKLAENSNWDMGMYFSELKEMNDLGFDLSLVGVDADSMNLSFNPNTEPSYNFNDVEQNDINNAQDNINKQISNLSAEDSDNAIELVCPHCAETFKFSGM